MARHFLIRYFLECCSESYYMTASGPSSSSCKFFMLSIHPVFLLYSFYSYVLLQNCFASISSVVALPLCTSHRLVGRNSVPSLEIFVLFVFPDPVTTEFLFFRLCLSVYLFKLYYKISRVFNFGLFIAIYPCVFFFLCSFSGCRSFFIWPSSLTSHAGFVILFGFPGSVSSLSQTSFAPAEISEFDSLMLHVGLFGNNLFSFLLTALIFSLMAV